MPLKQVALIVVEDEKAYVVACPKKLILWSVMSAVVATAEAASQGGLSLKTKAELSATPPTSSPELLEVKLENMAPNSTTQQASSSSSSNPSEGDKSTSDNGKRIQNNNTSNYNNGGGRLKFYKGKFEYSFAAQRLREDFLSAAF